MKKDGYYSSGEFAKMAQVTLRTIRYYDTKNILKPSYVNEYGVRFYTEEDLAKLQQILLLKYLGFSLKEIQELTWNNFDRHLLLNSLDIQLKLVKNRIEQMQLVEQAIRDTSHSLRVNGNVNWSQMRELIHLTGMEKSMKSQYENASNINARIQLHERFSNNPQGWFPWIYKQCPIQEANDILEIGCGDGTLWVSNELSLPSNVHITLTDVSDGMLRDARRNITSSSTPSLFSFAVADAHHLPFDDNSFDIVIANHVLFYCEDLEKVCQEIQRVLRPGGHLIASTYGSQHMREVNDLVTSYDSRIVLSSDKLYHRFGKENGASLLTPYFDAVRWIPYEDSLTITEAEPLISYILSCHGNQNQYLSEHYADFRTFVEKRIQNGFHITKDAGVFITDISLLS